MGNVAPKPGTIRIINSMGGETH